MIGGEKVVAQTLRKHGVLATVNGAKPQRILRATVDVGNPGETRWILSGRRVFLRRRLNGQPTSWGLVKALELGHGDRGIF